MERSESHQKIATTQQGKPSVIKKWLSRQAIWQVHLPPPPKHVNRLHYKVMIPNELHQLDLLYMSSDMLYGIKYKYILSGIDAASRYKVARPLRTKHAADIATMTARINKVHPSSHLSQEISV